MDFLNFPGDPVFTAETTPIGAGKVVLEIYGNGGAATAATDISIDNSYKITSLGTSDFTTLGAATNTIGTIFTATSDGSVTSGTGTATLVRKLNFQVSGSTVIKKDPNFPSMISIEQQDDPIFIEVWRHSSDTIFMRYLGLFSE